MRRHRVQAFALTAVLTSASVLADSSDYRLFDDPALAQGRALWLDNCESCHGYGIAGAPIPMQPGDWRARVAKDRAVLYGHALEGFFGADDTYMPPRGGNPKLNDDQVRLAVDYMVNLASYYLRQEETP